MEPSEFAAKRYNQYKQEKRKTSIKNGVIAWIFKLLKAITELLQKTKIIRKRKVETVKVE
jgi:hypothetical protein